MKTYTIGEIARLGLLKNHKGEPYKHKATITKLLQQYPKLKRINTPWGSGYSITMAEIEKINRRWL